MRSFAESDLGDTVENRLGNIALHHLADFADADYLPFLQKHGPLAYPGDAAEAVAHEQDRNAALAEFGHAIHRLFLEHQVSDGENLIEDQHFRPQVDGNGEAEP